LDGIAAVKEHVGAKWLKLDAREIQMHIIIKYYHIEIFMNNSLSAVEAIYFFKNILSLKM